MFIGDHTKDHSQNFSESVGQVVLKDTFIVGYINICKLIKKPQNCKYILCTQLGGSKFVIHMKIIFILKKSRMSIDINLALQTFIFVLGELNNCI